MNDIIILNPVFKETIWGGERLKTQYNFDIPSYHTGENWCISAHHNGDCEIANGAFKGKKLSWLYENHRELFGNMTAPEFPILVKWIDANDDLSVQVHPDDQYAKEHEDSLGKSECWYVVDCDKETKMVMGHHAKTKDELFQAIEKDDYDSLLNVIHIAPGDFYWIPSGTLHAICAGSLIYEVQQSSDITYRVYDYHRKDANGNLRELHVQKSLEVVDVPYLPQQLNYQCTQQEDMQKVNYLDNHIFKVSKVNVDGKYQIENHEPMRLMTVLEGEGLCNQEKITKGMSFIITSEAQKIVFKGHLVMIETLLGGK